MTDEQKINLANTILNFIADTQVDDHRLIPKYIGYLNRDTGAINGFKPALKGTPVFEFNNRYMLMLESLDGKTNVEMTYYKRKDSPFPDWNHLEDSIDFI